MTIWKGLITIVDKGEEYTTIAIMGLAMNTKPESKLPSYADFIQKILASVNGPVSIEALVEQLSRARPSSANNPHRALLTKIREQEGWMLVCLDAEQILPVRLAFNGAR